MKKKREGRGGARTYVTLERRGALYVSTRELIEKQGGRCYVLDLGEDKLFVDGEEVVVSRPEPCRPVNAFAPDAPDGTLDG